MLFDAFDEILHVEKYHSCAKKRLFNF